jgi:hypothetical protein
MDLRLIQLANSDIALIIIGFILVILLSVLLSISYGEGKGVQKTLSLPNMRRPSLPEVTILGKYLIPLQSTEQMVNTLRDWLMSNGYLPFGYPNVVKIYRVKVPPQAAKAKSYFDKLRLTRDGLPAEMTLNIRPYDPDPNFSEVEATCLPVMHNKLGQEVQFLFPESSVKDAQRRCKDFMADTMCVLGAKVLAAPYIEDISAQKPKLEFFANILTQSDINKKAHELMAKAKTRIHLTGWIDREFLGDIEDARTRGVEVRVVTKSPEASDKTVREDFKRLSDIFGKNVKINSRVHDRFLLCDKDCIIGSIYYVGASKTRFESAVYTDAENVVNEMEEHFSKIWNDVDSKTLT